MSANAAGVIEIVDSSDGEDYKCTKRNTRLASAKGISSKRPRGMDSASWKLIQQLQTEDNNEVQILPSTTQKKRSCGISKSEQDDDDDEVQIVSSTSKKKRSRRGIPDPEQQSLALVAKLQEEEDRQRRRQERRKHAEEKLGLSVAKTLQEEYTEETKRVAKILQPTPNQVFDDLKPCQQQAVSYVRNKAKSMHEAALPKLRQRVTSLGLTEEDLTTCLDYIKEEAAIIIHVQPATLSLLTKDTYYRNLFETKTSGGSKNTGARKTWEKSMFGDSYDAASAFDRPKYGCLNITGDIQGVRVAQRYGTCYLLLHQHVRHRTTFFNKDTGAFVSTATLATSDYYAHILQEYNDTELQWALNVASTSRIRGAASTCVVYKEVQIHGPVCLATDVQALSVPGREKDASQQLKEDVLEFQKIAKCNVLWQGDLLNTADGV